VASGNVPLDAVQFTVVVPTGKVYGEVITVVPILYTTVGAGIPVVDASNETDWLHWPVAAVVVIFPGQLMVGGTVQPVAAFNTTGLLMSVATQVVF
jgi:hypothetical protein